MLADPSSLAFWTLAALCCVALAALLAALHHSLDALGEVGLLEASEAKGIRARTAGRLLANQRSVSVRLRVGRVLFVVLSVVAGQQLVPNELSDPLQVAAPWAVGLITALVYAFSAIALSEIARVRAATWALPLAIALRPFEFLLAPIAWPVSILANRLDERVQPLVAPSADHAVREVEHMIEKQEESGTIPEDFAELIRGVLEFNDTVAREVMIPRTQMKAIDIEDSVDDVLQLINASGHSRYPVYRDRADQIVGILYAKDLFRVLQDGDRRAPLHKLIRHGVFFVSETHKIGALLREMQVRGSHLAIVVDEFGGTSGIVTLEDIIEEIVGEIRDEHDREAPMVQRIGRGRWWVDARYSIYDLSDLLKVELEEGDFDSLGGLIVELAGRVPLVGESVSAHGFTFVVRGADERRVTTVEIARSTADEESE